MKKVGRWFTVKIGLLLLSISYHCVNSKSSVSIERFHIAALCSCSCLCFQSFILHHFLAFRDGGGMLVLENTAVAILRTLALFSSTCTIQTSLVLFIIYCLVEQQQDSCLWKKNERKKKKKDRRPHSAPRTCNLRQKFQT